MNIKTVFFIALIGLLTACAAPATSAPASPTTAPGSATVAESASPAATDINTPEAVSQPQAAGSVSFAKDILPLLTSRCGSCHGDSRRQEGLSVTSYANLMAGSNNGAVILPGNADGSLLVDEIVSQKMPKRGPKLTPDEMQIIIDWVNQGAADN